MPSFREQMKGFPLWQMTVICIIRFSEPIAFTSLFPYVYFMIRDFHIVDDPAKISKYTGYMGASFAFAQFLCCIHWGRLSDRIGRKPVLLLGLLGTATSLLIFGFSTNFYMAITARTLMGALNGNIAVLQTMVGEVVKERRHQSMAFSCLPLLWNVGCVVGPSIGGSRIFTRPKMSSGDVKSLGSYDRFVEKHPYAMSNVVVACLLLFSFVVGLLFLEETQPKAKLKYDYGLAFGDRILIVLGFSPLAQSKKSEDIQETPSETTPLTSDAIYDSIDESAFEEDDDDRSISSFDQPLTRRTSLAIIRRYSSSSLQRTTTNTSVFDETKSIFKAFRNKKIFSNKVRATILAYFCLSFHALVHSEFLPVFLAGKFQPELLQFPWHYKGGMSWETSRIGSLLSTTGFGGCFIIIVVFPILDRHMRNIDVLRIASVVFPVAYLLVPYTIFTRPEYEPKFPSWLSTAGVYTCASFQSAAAALSFPQMVILVYRATIPKHRAFVNSTAISCTALARCVAPLLWGALMSFFDSRGVGQVSWNILAVIALFTLILAFKLDEYDEDLHRDDQMA
uniref:Major facilitator superfamily (MFS) profile domain-containing protein n=1 Tax=Candidozyma auris TaxID=498019 RepID=A0A0L0P4R3_CANAR